MAVHPFDDGHYPLDLQRGEHLRLAGDRGLATDVDDVGPVRDQPVDQRDPIVERW